MLLCVTVSYHCSFSFFISHCTPTITAEQQQHYTVTTTVTTTRTTTTIHKFLSVEELIYILY